uniref:NADH-ubiquinone oxidoreductase chain 6 n=1 Tax=Agrilinae sp. 1 ACP-2013 TaxID=1434404 RepID=A0A3G4RYG6_9COLE|nr:NADH dehydrogenase subunit 6 [Agrilinae sp. 1 ACP-2013]
MLLLTSLSLTVSFAFFISKHPISMGFSLLMQTIMISLMTGLINLNFWYSFILFLIMVGGMLVIFIYMTSVASNEKFKPSIEMIFMMMSIITMMLVLMMIMEPMMLKTETISLLTQALPIKNVWALSLTKFITYPQNMKLIMMMSYLFLALIAIVKITNIKYGPLRVNN